MAIASGVLLPWLGTHAGVPSGFTRKTDLDDRYPLGSPASTNPNVTGGSATHTHSTTGHTHTVGSHSHGSVTSAGPSSTVAVDTGASATASSSHTHSIPASGSTTATLNSESPTTAAGSSLPSSYEVIWIESDGSTAGVPNNGWALWATDPQPASWTVESGPSGKYLKGAPAATNAGSSVGGTHVHAGSSHDHAFSTHTHSGGTSGSGSGSINRGGSGATVSDAAHTHAVSVATAADARSGAQTSGNSGSGSTNPASYKLAVIKNTTGAAALPTGTIGAWLGTLASIPANWILCDGTSGTPDLRDRMIVGAASDLSDIGDTTAGGNHSHSAPTAHSHNAAHTHQSSLTNPPSATVDRGASGTNVARSTHGHNATTNGSAGGTSGTTAETISDATALPPYRTVAWIYYNYTPPAARTVPATANVQTTQTRTVPATANVQVTNTRTVPASANVQVTNTRTVPASANVEATETRTVPATANVQSTETRTVPAAADVAMGRVIPTSANVEVDGITRTVPAAANVLEAHERTVPATANVLEVGTRTVPAAANIEAPGSRSVPTSANVEATETRTVPATANVQETGLTRPVPASANVREGGARSVPAAGAVVVSQPIIPPVIPPATAQQVYDALSGLYGSVAMRFRYSRRTRTNDIIDELDGVPVGGSIELNNLRAVRRGLSLTLDLSRLPADFNVGTDILGVSVEVYVPQASQWVEIPLGLYVLDASETRYRADVQLVPVQGADLGMLLLRSVRTSAYAVAAGTPYMDAVAAILDRHGFARSLPTSGDALPIARTWPAGTNEFTICRDLLAGINYLPPWPDARGIFRTRERIAPSSETAAVAYQNTAEPRMISGRDDYVVSIDRKPANRVEVVIDDPAHPDVGYVQRELADTDAPNSTGSLAFGDAAAISSSSVDALTTHITTAAAHGFSTGVQVLISGHEGSTPDINGSYEVTVVSDTVFTIPVAVTVGGTGGTAQATTVQIETFNGESEPPTFAILDTATAEAFAEYELLWSALIAERAELPTFFDPRREAHEYYSLDMTDPSGDVIEEEQLFGVIGWSFDLRPGAIMRHIIGRARELDILSPPQS